MFVKEFKIPKIWNQRQNHSFHKQGNQRYGIQKYLKIPNYYQANL